MIRTISLAITGAVLVALPLRAQSLERRIVDAANGGSGTVQFTFASRPGVCGDGVRFLSDGFGGDNRIYYDGGNSNGQWDDDWNRCVHGPVRIVATTSGGEIVRLRTFAGPAHTSVDSDRRDLGAVSVAEAVHFLDGLVEQARGRPAGDAILPIVLADSIDPWPMLLRFARNEQLPRSVHSTAALWLSRGAAAALGVNARDRDEDDEVRTQAVFALSQQPRQTAVPRLIEIVHTSTHPAVRAQALFWLGQTGDPRAIDLFEEILRRR